MKILHLSNNGLPDTRVERSAQTGKKEGHNIGFAGPFIKGLNLPVNAFDKFYKIPFNKFANVRIPFYWGALKRKLSQILSEYRPDFVHAHNVVAAKLISEFPVPFIYDDQEYWSKHSKFRDRDCMQKPQKMLINRLWAHWGKEVLGKAFATITVSETITEEHKRSCNHVYTAPNLPTLIETKSLRLVSRRNDKLSSVYVGGTDFSFCLTGACVPRRDVDGVLRLFGHNNVGTLTVIGDPNLPSFRNVHSLGFVPHQKMMNELTKHHVGLLPWKKHWFHKYCNPNKPYEYAHAGLLVLSVSDLPCVMHRLGEYCVTFNDLHELRELLLHYADRLDEIRELRPRIRKFALENLTWEKECEPEILKAYSKI